ncbi:hypothetical protein IE077_001860 [Cardiosporidium cionae]|uniref:Uncharacterized protein n=1 Tax=Cardiosporidium cionae TaxID=476202 RepID=A0ABQ7JCE7_9APIC|nr:hypothetical protein IE077_001860 [Cardiosporidium cionae]|eukprot:KAF8821564.1 hypothetical protein IE077_001860 [Cardiosporidium cionae]
MEFPAYRSEEWLRQQLNEPQNKEISDIVSNDPLQQKISKPSLVAPPQVLQGVRLSPAYMYTFETIGMYPKKVESVRQSIRDSLFRQSLFKVQNVEVMYIDSCRANRVLKKIVATENRMQWPTFFNNNSTLLHEELWTVDRCGVDTHYRVRYYMEGDNGFSSRVIPCGIRDKWNSLKYYFSSD